MAGLSGGFYFLSRATGRKRLARDSENRAGKRRTTYSAISRARVRGSSTQNGSAES